MATGEPLNKKLKTEDDCFKYFKDFLAVKSNQKLLDMLRIILSEFKLGWCKSHIVFLRVKAANADANARFTKATVNVEVHQEKAPFSLFFVDGYATLAEFVNSGKPKVPRNLTKRRALRDLLQFLTIANEQTFITENTCQTLSEAALAIHLAEHLLIPLVPHKTFVIDSYSDQSERCCNLEHPPHGTKGDTSFGCPNGWHGRADILLVGDEVPMTVVGPEEDNGDSDDIFVSSDSSEEITKGENFPSESMSQIIAQTIVYSFIQNRKTQPPNSLVPGIAFSSNKLLLYLYDCREDILIKTMPIGLFVASALDSERILSYRAIIILWLGLNYNLFGNATPDKYKHCKSGFHGRLGKDLLETYLNKSQQPFKAKSDENVNNDGKDEEVINFEDDVTDYIEEERDSVFL